MFHTAQARGGDLVCVISRGEFQELPPELAAAGELLLKRTYQDTKEVLVVRWRQRP